VSNCIFVDPTQRYILYISIFILYYSRIIATKHANPNSNHNNFADGLKKYETQYWSPLLTSCAQKMAANCPRIINYLCLQAYMLLWLPLPKDGFNIFIFIFFNASHSPWLLKDRFQVKIEFFHRMLNEHSDAKLKMQKKKKTRK
jgi:hypothetical protein